MDLISRHAAIEAISDCGICIQRIVDLPSVQPEFTESEIQKIQELEQAQIKKAYELGFEEGKESARREMWEDGRDRLD